MLYNDIITPEIQKLNADNFILADKSSANGRKARSFLTVGVMQSLGAEVTAELFNAKGETTFRHTYTIADAIDREWRDATAKGHNGAKGALIDRAIQRLSGLPIVTDDMRDAFRDVSVVCLGLIREGVDPKDVKISAKGNLELPGRIMAKVPKDDAKESVWDDYESECARPVKIDGSEGKTFTDLKNRLTPRQKREGNAGQGMVLTPQQAFDAALDRVLDGLKINGDEMDIDLMCDKRRAKLVKLADLIEEALTA